MEIGRTPAGTRRGSEGSSRSRFAGRRWRRGPASFRLSERQARGRAPEPQPSGLDIDARSAVDILQRAQVAHLAAQAKVIAEKPHHAGAKVVRKVVARQWHADEAASIDVRA